MENTDKSRIVSIRYMHTHGCDFSILSKTGLFNENDTDEHIIKWIIEALLHDDDMEGCKIGPFSRHFANSGNGGWTDDSRNYRHVYKWAKRNNFTLEEFVEQINYYWKNYRPNEELCFREIEDIEVEHMRLNEISVRSLGDIKQDSYVLGDDCRQFAFDSDDE